MIELAYTLIGAISTLFIKWLLDLFADKIKDKKERRKMVFQRKAEAAENAMSAYLELYNSCYSMRDAFSRITPKLSGVNMAMIENTIANHQQVISRVIEKTNPVQLYYNFSKIEKEYHINDLNKTLYSLNEVMGKTHVDIRTAIQQGLTDEQLAPTYEQLCEEYHLYAQALDGIMNATTAILNMLREDYKKYLD